MREAGMETRIDAGGNVIGVLPGCDRRRRIVLGSHTDTVEGGGRFDGNVGVFGAIEVVRALSEAGIRLDHDLVVIDFFSEELNRYGISCMGSRALTGTLDPAILDRTDLEGVRLGDALAGAGIDAARIGEAAADWSTTTAFLELHIEQGPHMEELGTRLALVERITGVSRFHALFQGRRDHAGTTPMRSRSDAGCAAAATVLAVESIAGGTADAKGTSGAISFSPQAVNVVTELAEVSGEFRSPDGTWLREAEERLTDAASREAASRRGTVRLDWLPTQEPEPLSADLNALAAGVIDRLGHPRATMFSGAEHDAAVIARHAPTTMLFIPSVGGRSHCPEEWTDLDDITAGVHALAETVVAVDTR
jgi:N-carbamoyl-L-amino-acid hydrolase